MHTMNPFSSMLYVSTVLSSWRIFPIEWHEVSYWTSPACAHILFWGGGSKKRRGERMHFQRTRIDELQLRHLPSFFLGDLLLDLSDLKWDFDLAPHWLLLTSFSREQKSTYRFWRLCLDDELLLFQILQRKRDTDQWCAFTDDRQTIADLD